jgi:hypothetical protein
VALPLVLMVAILFTIQGPSEDEDNLLAAGGGHMHGHHAGGPALPVASVGAGNSDPNHVH